MFDVEAAQGPVVEEQQGEGEGDEHGFGHEAEGKAEQAKEDRIVMRVAC